MGANLCEADDGLRQAWTGRVRLNPPFDRYKVAEWIGRLAGHGRMPRYNLLSFVNFD